MKTALQAIGIGLIVLVIIVVSMFLYNLERAFNFNLSYKAMVQHTIREMVKKEALR